MNNFWTNIFRYPRFFISSLLGLILVIITPFKSLFKTSSLRVFSILFILLGIIALSNVLINMLGL
uniref:Uncharacterized protein ycf33 n=1 Tax=Biddulphia biddulphiana TaxID=1158022 RepID=A0A2U9NSD3_9STRA|nr:hypothetical protein ycf33 [Biddulphia biddulphiana]AWT40027.1 hypothetical protein ycf33 [Biddulphia biddulphiana]